RRSHERCVAGGRPYGCCAAGSCPYGWLPLQGALATPDRPLAGGQAMVVAKPWPVAPIGAWPWPTTLAESLAVVGHHLSSLPSLRKHKKNA
ncbi:hypothetical protein B296_00052230, partial [Ensete ventricosum]